MSGHGGARPNAGRKKNGRNRLTEEAMQRAEAGGLLPLDYMLSIMRDERTASDVRLDAAKAAAPYVHAKLANIQVEADIDAHIDHGAAEEAARRAIERVDRILATLGRGKGDATGSLSS